MWVLIMFLASQNFTGMTSVQVSFSSQSACEAALTKITSGMNGQQDPGEIFPIYSVCVLR